MSSQPGATDCPLCERECEGRDDLRFHLQTYHAKSDLVEQLFAALEGSKDRAGVEAAA